MLPCIQAWMAHRKESVVPGGALTGTVIEVPAGRKIVSSRASSPGPPPTLMNCAVFSSTICGPTVLKISSHRVPGSPHEKTSSTLVGSSLWLTIVRVWGSSVASAWTRVIESPLLIVVMPGLNLRFEEIFELMWTSSVPIVLMVLFGAPLALVPTDIVTAASAATAASRTNRDDLNTRIAEPICAPPSEPLAFPIRAADSPPQGLLVAGLAQGATRTLRVSIDVKIHARPEPRPLPAMTKLRHTFCATVAPGPEGVNEQSALPRLRARCGVWRSRIVREAT